MNFQSNKKYNIIFADYVYENLDFSWVNKFWEYLKPNSLFISMTDFHSEHRYRVYLEDVIGATFVNHLVWKNEWGRGPSDRFHECYDSIFVYSNSKKWPFNREKIQVPKATTTKGLNPSGRITKTATAWINDICLTTTAKERVIQKDGHLAKWQKPLRLYDRIILPFLSDDATILDIFMGVGTLGRWSRERGYPYTGIELDKEKFNLAYQNINGTYELC
jgi:DNA modification methylase